MIEPAPLQHVKDTGKVPPGGGWIYVNPEDFHTIKHPYIGQVRARAHSYRVINNMPIPTNWEAQFEDNICRNTPGDVCEPADKAIRLSFALIKQFTASMARWIAAGMPLVSDDKLAARRAVCEGTETTPRCAQWYNSTPYFGFGRCGKCGCLGGLKTPLATEKCPLGKWPS